MSVNFGTAHIDKTAAVSGINFEALDDENICQNTQCTNDLKFKMNFKNF
jgi:hypothetical protein